MVIGLNSIRILSENWKNKKIGLVTGCFDVLHLGHVNLFEFAKNSVDILLVGLESDASIQLNKGKTRPYFAQDVRLKVVDSIKFVDYTFLIDHKLKYSSPKYNNLFTEICEQIGVTHLITHKQVDSSYKKKEALVSKLGIKLILQDEDKFSSSIIRDLGL